MLVLLVACLAAPAGLHGAESYFVRGIVRDSISGASLPYASVVAADGNGSAVTDADGVFEINVSPRTTALKVSCVGYARKVLPIRRGRLNVYAVYLSPEATELSEVVVRRAKYSKKNNPAVDLARRLRRDASLTDPLRLPFYSYDKYERFTLGLNDFNTADHAGLMRQFPFLAAHTDTSEVSGKSILPLMVKEKASVMLNRHSPGAHKEVVRGRRSEGVDEAADAESMRIFVEDVIREVDLYQNDITLLQNRFVSPLSPIAPDFYRFYLTDTVALDGRDCLVLSFYPRNKSSFGFNGHVYVPMGDTTMFIRKVDMSLPAQANINFIDGLYLSQSYTRAPDGSRLKQRDDLVIEIAAPGKGGLYARRNTTYTGHSFDSIPPERFAFEGPVAVQPEAERRDSLFWQQARRVELAPGESHVGLLVQRLRRVPLYYWGEKVLQVAFSSYIPTGNPSRFDIGPVNSMLSFNNVEGVRVKFGGMTSAALSRRWFGRFFVAYGFKDRKVKYSAEAEYSFIDKADHSRQFPMRSVRLTSAYDIYRPGQNFLYTTPDNIVLSVKRRSDDHVAYRRLNSAAFIWETRTGFSVDLTLASEHLEAAPAYMPFTDGYGHNLSHYTQNYARLTLRYAPGEKFFQARSYRIPVNLDAPAITLRHTVAPGGLLGTRYTVNTTELDLQKRFWFSAFGYLDVYAGGGHVWGSAPFMSLMTPNANLSYIIEPRSFALLEPMEFMCSSFATWDVTYRANGALFNLIPGLKRLKLREVFGCRGYWGRLDSKCDPALNPYLLQFPAGTGLNTLSHGPYMEAAVGIENILRVLRVDYVWRLNYRHPGYPVDRHGVRLAMRVKF